MVKKKKKNGEGHPETMGHRAESNKQSLLGFSLSATLRSYYDALN